MHASFVQFIVHGQDGAAVAFMGIASVNIYAGAIIVYIIVGMANTDKRASNLTYDDSSCLVFFRVSKRDEGEQGRSQNDSATGM